MDDPQAPPEKKLRPEWFWPVVIAGGVGLAAAVAFLLAGGVDPQPDDGGGAIGAETVCEQFVEDRLKAPSTADFSDPASALVSAARSEWVVTGAVDSENSFGAMLRSDYECRVRYAGDEEWRLVDLQFTD